MRKMLLVVAAALVSAGCGLSVNPLPDPIPTDFPITLSPIPTTVIITTLTPAADN